MNKQYNNYINYYNERTHQNIPWILNSDPAVSEYQVNFAKNGLHFVVAFSVDFVGDFRSLKQNEYKDL